MDREDAVIAIVVLVLVSIVTVMTLYMLDISTRVGPGCPGDPEWLGWCSEVDGS